MNAALATTIGDLTRTLRSAMPEPVVGDVAMWARDVEPPYPTFAYAMRHLAGASSFMPLAEAKARLAKALEMERGRQQRGHWSRDLNRLIALSQLSVTIARFEAERA